MIAKSEHTQTLRPCFLRERFRKTSGRNVVIELLTGPRTDCRAVILRQLPQMRDNDSMKNYPMDARTWKGIRRGVLYLVMDADEGKHYSESGKPKNHIFLDAMRVARWLDRNQPK
jgi:hypothetical protein